LYSEGVQKPQTTHWCWSDIMTAVSYLSVIVLAGRPAGPSEGGVQGGRFPFPPLPARKGANAITVSLRWKVLLRRGRVLPCPVLASEKEGILRCELLETPAFRWRGDRRRRERRDGPFSRQRSSIRWQPPAPPSAAFPSPRSCTSLAHALVFDIIGTSTAALRALRCRRVGQLPGGRENKGKGGGRHAHIFWLWLKTLLAVHAPL